MSGSVKRDPNGRTWNFRFDGPPKPDGSRNQIRERGFSSKRDADRAMRERQLEVWSEARPTGGETLVEFFRRYVGGLDGRAPTTILSYSDMVDVHVASHPVANKALHDITPMDMEAILEVSRSRPGRGGKRLSSKTMRNLFNFLRSGLDHAAKTGRISANPMSGLTAPRVRRDPDSMKFWTPDEARTFLAFVEAPEHPADATLADIVRLALLTGMRRGEILGLKWIDVDEEQRTLSVKRTRTGVGAGIHEGPPKTSHGRRTLQLSPAHLQVLASVRERQAYHRSLFGDAWVDTDLVFTDIHGEGLVPDAVSQRFKRLVALSGVRQITFHDLRHTHASIAIGKGEHIKAVSARLGHSDIGFTLRQYTHLMPEHHNLPADHVAEELFGPQTSCDQTCDQPGPDTQGAPPERGSDLRVDGGGGGI